jgi:hypothetical protein
MVFSSVLRKFLLQCSISLSSGLGIKDLFIEPVQSGDVDSTLNLFAWVAGVQVLVAVSRYIYKRRDRKSRNLLV